MFTINTNVHDSKIPDSFITEISSLLAETIGKPEMVDISPSRALPLDPIIDLVFKNLSLTKLIKCS
jgi:hypothetical protein